MIEEEIAKKIKEIAGEDAQIFAVVVQMKGEGAADYLKIASLDEGYLRCVLGAVDELKESSRVTRETEKAELWIPKSVIERVRP